MVMLANLCWETVGEAGDEEVGVAGDNIFSASFVYCFLATTQVFVNCLLSSEIEAEIWASCSWSSLDLLQPSSSWYSELIS